MITFVYYFFHSKMAVILRFLIYACITVTGISVCLKIKIRSFFWNTEVLSP